ncbi:FAD-dependent oxidoreductase [Saccharopolyspora gloriosae]|uniref:ferredoxin--NADP(+) reductase n=1 Tax=Saccharopolyspora gloriosae TaxID=455344 RepID=A0A840NIN3_9PSEU|nr:FAD-dependent oxidoreductase [Saccharopolyspora gloriosae]MBB5069032.1 ferredoxin--NADP+ reductase [Saccharopolyspora gloriosae]
MAYAITQTCCNDASCVSVCPVNCIHPTPEEPGFGSTDMLYVDPQTCIDCGACADACPVDAIFPVDRLRGADTIYARLNREYYETTPTSHEWGAPRFPRSLPASVGTLRVAIVGTGPAAAYTAQALLRDTGAELTMIDRLPIAGGLLRSGVAPDHQSTKKIGDGFSWLYRHPRLNLHMNVEVGRDITHEELAAHHHAVIYAVGAAADRELDVDGADLPGSMSATSFVAWYNAHPDAADVEVDLSAERAVVVGNGNVALDVARILLSDPERLASTDIADHALRRLRGSEVREVVLLARRGPEHAAFTTPEFLAMREIPGVELVVRDGPEARAAFADAEPGGKAALLAELPIEDADRQAPPGDGKRLVFAFGTEPVAVLGDDRVDSVRVHDAGGEGAISTGLLIRAIGYRSSPIAGLPFDTTTSTVPNESGRVLAGAGEPMPGTYVVGWAKRGPSGGIGTNRGCAGETVGTLMDDAAAGRLAPPEKTGFDRLVRTRAPGSVGSRGMLAIDKAERDRGAREGRPRVKFATTPELLGAANRRFGR